MRVKIVPDSGHLSRSGRIKVQPFVLILERGGIKIIFYCFIWSFK